MSAVPIRNECFEARVMPEPMSGCWLWMGAVTNGYGVLQSRSRQVGAHRFSYESARGPIPLGLVIDHLCRTPLCVNPAHMEAVTHRTNILRGESKAASRAKQTHCKNGHEFDEANTYRYPNGSRECRTCYRANKRRWWAERKQKAAA